MSGYFFEGKIVVPLPGKHDWAKVHNYFIYRVDLAGNVTEAVVLSDGGYHWIPIPDWAGLYSLNLIKYKRLSLGQLVNADRRLARDRGVGLD